MKIDKLFKIAESFFNMGKKKQKKNCDKKQNIELSLDKKIDSTKQKIKKTESKKRKAELKENLKILKKLKSKIQ